MSQLHARWGSRIAFIFAASAAAIGLGNIWRFPFMVGEHGGGVFVLTYLAAVLILGVPLVIAEVALGRLGRASPTTCFKNLAIKSRHSKHWGWIGSLTILTAFLVVSYYVVIVGWVLDYFVQAITGVFHNITEAQSLQNFRVLQASHWQMIATTTLTIAGSAAILLLGLKKGLERAVLFMFPALLCLMLMLLGYAMTTSGFDQALSFLFHPDFTKLTANMVLLALGQAFFSLNIAMAITVMFSAYLPEKTPLVSSAIAIVIADTAYAILAGLIIFPIVFTNNLSPEAGPSLIFKTLPIAFGKLPYGSVIATLFFLLLFFAAFTSVIALFEPAAVWLMEKTHINRTKAVVTTAFVCWVLSLGSIFSFSHGANLSLLHMNFYQLIDMITANIMLPIGGLLTALFAGWFLHDTILHKELNWNTKGFAFKAWRFILRYFAPLVIVLILLASLHII